MPKRWAIALIILIFSSMILTWTFFSYPSLFGLFLIVAMLLLVGSLRLRMFDLPDPYYMKKYEAGEGRRMRDEREDGSLSSDVHDESRVGLSGYWADRLAFSRFRRR